MHRATMHRLAATVMAIAGFACANAKIDPDAAYHPTDARRTDAALIDAPGHPDADPTAPDAAVTPDAAGTPDAAVPAGAHLLLSEVVLTPTAGEMIEIVNPTAATVTLTDYYLTDVPTYFRLPAGTQTIDSTDFIGRFPAGATIGPGAVITVAVDTAANFTATYASAPTYSLQGGTMIVTANGTLNLTNAGEPVILFHWDGASDLVEDVDIVNAGAPSGGNVLVAKTGVAIDGPDVDTTPTAYATDALTLPTKSAPGAGKSQKRILGEAGREQQTGAGNGLSGDDETSEQIDTTWDSTYTAPTPGTAAI